MSTQLIKQNQQQKNSPILFSRLSQLKRSLPIKIEKNKTQNKQQLPALSRYSQSKIKQSKRVSLQNRHLHYLFYQFCKQSYMGGPLPTFDQIAKSAQKMTLNKWMAFCKQFQLTKHLSQRQIMQIFKTSTNNKSQMALNEFCIALKVFQQKAKINQTHFTKNILYIDNHTQARDRLSSMKISFNGPKVNYFVQSHLTEKQRYQQKSAKKKQLPNKTREIILHQGMSKEHIELSLIERKQKRHERTESLRNRSAFYDSYNYNSVEKKNPQTSQNNSSQKIFKSNYGYITTNRRKTKRTFENYSTIFKTKRDNQKLIDTSKFQQIAKLNDKNTQGSTTETQNKSRLHFEKLKTKTHQQIQDQIHGLPIVVSDNESDEILRTHYQNEKRINNKSSLMLLQQENDNDGGNDDDRKTELMITKY